MFKPSKEAILISEVPKKCPECELPLAQTAPKSSKKSHCFILLGIVLTIIWMLIFFNFIYKGNPDSVYTRQVAIVIIFNSWPALIVGFIASRLPQIIHRKCIKCKWDKTYEIKLPEIKNK